MRTSNVLHLVYGVTAALIGVLFFFIIVGVFGLPFAIAGLAVFVLGAVVVFRGFQPRELNYETRSFHSRQNSICLYGELSHHFPDNVNRACFLLSSDRSALAENQKPHIPPGLSVLAQHFRYELRDWCCHRNCAFVRVWSRIRSLCTDGWTGHWSLDRTRGLDRLFPGGRLFGNHALWSSSRRP